MQDTLAATIGELWAEYLPLERERLAVIERVVNSLGPVSDARRDEAREEAHRLAGVLSAVGHLDAADDARGLERALETRPARSQRPMLLAHVISLRAVLEGPPLGSAR